MLRPEQGEGTQLLEPLPLGHNCTDQCVGSTHLQVPVDHAHLLAMQGGLQDLLSAMTACKHQGQR